MIHYLVFSCLFLLAKGSILKNLQHYETIHADDISHKIVKRGVPESTHPFNKIKEVSFNTHGRDFRLILSPKRTVLHSNFKAYEVDGDGKETAVHIEHEDFYNGRVFGEIDSHVNLHMEDNLITGSIQLPNEIYHIEPSWRHSPDVNNRTMITYKQSDIKFSWDHDSLPMGHLGPKVCGYIKENEELEEEPQHSRVKRQLDEDEFTPIKTKCSLLLVADFRFYQEMGGNNTKTTVNYLISLIDRVHKIYNDTIWEDQNGGFKGMGFVIKKIIVHNEPTRLRSGKNHYNMDMKEWDVRNLLEVFSRNSENKEVCLAHLFTHQTFKAKDSVVLGLAYIASPRIGSHGGICTADHLKGTHTLYLNSGLSSSRNYYGQRVITREADLVTAHELGHNWGSEHDADIPECAPSASHGGSYLMYTYSVSGYDINNKNFSPCSRRSIKKVLQNKSDRCFSEPEESFCGNLRVEGDEECDAGLVGVENNDPCCDKNCKLRDSADCSDKNSPCCENCRFSSNVVICREAQISTCREEAKCRGDSAECPSSPPMVDDTPCQEEGKCRSGECIPFCETQGLQSCMCDIIADSCKRCCRASINETCAPRDDAHLVPDGTPCIQGFCNKGICEKTVQDVVERFWNIIEDININKLLLFLKDNLVGTIVLGTAIVWIPISCLITYVDRKREEVKACEEFKGYDEWDFETTKNKWIHPVNRRLMHDAEYFEEI